MYKDKYVTKNMDEILIAGCDSVHFAKIYIGNYYQALF